MAIWLKLMAMIIKIKMYIHECKTFRMEIMVVLTSCRHDINLYYRNYLFNDDLSEQILIIKKTILDRQIDKQSHDQILFHR